MIEVYTLEEVDARILQPLGWTDGVRWLKRRIADGRIPGKRLNRNVFVMTDKHIDQWLHGDEPPSAAVEPSEPPAEAPPGDILYGLSPRSRRRLKRIH